MRIRLAALCLLAGALSAQTAKYPTAVATDADLKVAKNRIQTTLRGSITAGQTTIVVASATGIVPNQLLCVESEIVSVTSMVGTSLTVVRGFDGTTAVAHATGRAIGNCVAAWYWGALAAEVKAIQNTLGPNMSNVPSTAGGDVRGPAGATADRVAVFDGGTGKLLKDGGVTVAGLAPAAQGVSNGNTHNHFGGDGSAVPEDGLALADVTTWNASSLNHGFLPKLPNNSTQYLNGIGQWAAPNPSNVLTPSTYNFAQAPGGSLTAGFLATVTLSPVPMGVNHDDANHPLYISGGTGAAEAVLITGGTGHAGDASGTIQFTPANSHSGAWMVSSATAGCQEAVQTAGEYGHVDFATGQHEFYAPCTVTKHVSISGQGVDATTLHNNATTTGVLRLVSEYSSGTLFSGMKWQGFSVVAGSANNTAVDAVAASAIYIQDPNWNFTLADVFIANHSTGIRQVNGWFTMYRNINIRFFRDYGIHTDWDGAVGSGIGADQFLESVSISEAGATGTITDSGCAILYSNWSGLYLHQVTTTGAKRGLCLTTRVTHAPETYTAIYYGTVSDSKFDTSEHEGILIDSTNNKISTVKFTNVISAYNGCTPGADCTGSPFANAAHGISILGSNSVDLTFVGGTARENGGHGVSVAGTATQITFVGFDADANSQAATNTYDGYNVANGVYDVRIGFCFAGKVNTTLTRSPRYGIWIGTGGDNMQIGNVRFVANTTGTLSYGGGDHSLIGPNWPLTDNLANQMRPATISYATMAAWAAVNGTPVYCYNCNAACTAGGSTGRTCFRENSTWQPSGGGAVTEASLSFTPGSIVANSIVGTHGLMPALDGNASSRLSGIGTWVTSSSGGDTLSPVANTADYIPQWNGANSKTLKDGKAAPAGTIVGTTDTQTLSAKTLTTPIIGFYTVAGLPAATTAGKVAVVTDAATAGSCTAGGGSALSLCRASGAVWVSLGGSGGGATAGQGLTDFLPTVANDTVTVQGGNARIGNYAPTAIALGTAQFTAGSGDVKVFIDENSNLVCQMATGITATTTGSMTCSNSATPAFGENGIPDSDLTVGRAAESLSETAFTTHVNWDVTGDFDDSGTNATYTHSTGSGTLTQVAADQATAAIASTYYQFDYTVSGASHGDAACTITTAYALSAQTLTLTNGAQTKYFKSAAAPTDFVISCTSTSAGAVTFDNVSLKSITVALDTDERAVLSTRGVKAGSGIGVAEAGGIATISADADIPRMSGTNAFTGSNDFTGATDLYIRRGAGAPAAGECDAAAEVGQLYARSDPAAAGATLYVCANTGASAYAWEIAAGGGTGLATNTEFTKSISLFDPVAGDSGRIQFTFGQAVTITRVACSTKTATSTVTLNLDERAEATPDTAGTNVLSADLVADTGTRTSCAAGCDVNTITNGGIAANAPVALTIASVANTPTDLRCHVNYTIN